MFWRLWPISRARERADFKGADEIRPFEIVVAPSLTPDCYNCEGTPTRRAESCSSLSHPGLLQLRRNADTQG